MKFVAFVEPVKLDRGPFVMDPVLGNELIGRTRALLASMSEPRLQIRTADTERKIDPPPGFRSPGDDPQTYGLILRFDSDDPEFTRGFEAGALWARLETLAHGATIDAQVHDTNALMVERMAEARGCSYRIVNADTAGWLTVEFRKVEAS